MPEKETRIAKLVPKDKQRPKTRRRQPAGLPAPMFTLHIHLDRSPMLNPESWTHELERILREVGGRILASGGRANMPAFIDGHMRGETHAHQQMQIQDCTGRIVGSYAVTGVDEAIYGDEYDG